MKNYTVKADAASYPAGFDEREVLGEVCSCVRAPPAELLQGRECCELEGTLWQRIEYARQFFLLCRVCKTL